MSASLYAVRFDDGEVRYGYTDGYTLHPRLFATPEQAWDAYPGKADYVGFSPEEENGAGERVQLSWTSNAVWAVWATATRDKLTSCLDYTEWEHLEEDHVHPYRVRFTSARNDVVNWADKI